MKKELLKYLKSVQSLESDLYAYECSKEEIQRDIRNAEYEKEHISMPYIHLPSEPKMRQVDSLEYRIRRIKEGSYFLKSIGSVSFWLIQSMAVIAGFIISVTIHDYDDIIAMGIGYSMAAVTLLWLPAMAIGSVELRNEKIEEARNEYSNEMLHANNEYQAAYNEYQNTCQKLRKEFYDQKAENERKKQELSDRVVSLQNSLGCIEMNMAELREKIEQAYSVDIIYPKYRGLVPISMFVEYFETGRCDALTGHEGAYNLYESELRQNLIISSLKNITNKMDDMKQRQYRLYSAIKDANRISGEISKYAVESAKQNKLAADNAAITALHTKSLAESTKIIADIESEKLDELKKFFDID